ncbi:hypothetical protein JCM8115_000686 [Rhodotorula mucilaginosa]
MPRSTASPLARPSPASAVAASTPRHQPASPSRQARHAAVPGIITLPQSSSKHSSSRSSSPARSSRHQLAPPQPEPTALAKPADIVDGPAIAGQTKRRNREKKSTTSSTDSPLRRDATAPEPAAPDAAPDSPTKSNRKRRTGRAARQPSPPMPPTADANLFAAPPPPPTTSTSRSLGQDATRSAHYTALLNVEDEWDMPVLNIGGNQQQQDKSAKPKESLSWQQELLRAGSNTSSATTARNGNNGSPVSRPRSRVQPAKDLRPAPMTSNNSAGRSRPALATSHSDSFPSTSSSSSSLNWQQELLLRTDEVQLVQQVTATTTTTTAVTNFTPARQRRNQIKDSITFGIANLDLAATAAETDVFSGAPASSNRRQKRAAITPQVVVDNLVATPTKTAVEPRYAGPTFHNSPAPSALPMPSFMLRRQAVETVVATH